jgi:LysM repeat protein
MKWKNLFYFLLINIIVSAATTLIILNIWDRSHFTVTPNMSEPIPEFVIPTETRVEAASAPTVSLQPYQVAVGETLGEIALAYEITVDELLELNGFTDPDSIGAGATIFVPTLNENSSNNELDELFPEDGSNPEAPTSSKNNGKVEISGVVGAGDLRSERVQLRGLGGETIDLTRWQLRDEDGNEYTFPHITLFGNGAVDVFSDSGVDTVVALYWNTGEPVWESGETVTLYDEAGNIQAAYTVP